MDWLLNKKSKEEIRELYNDPSKLVIIEFANRGPSVRNIWVELACESIDVDAHTEYLILTHDRHFRIEFCEDGNLIFYLQQTFGFMLYRRPTSEQGKDSHEWELVFDTSYIG